MARIGKPLGVEAALRIPYLRVSAALCISTQHYSLSHQVRPIDCSSAYGKLELACASSWSLELFSVHLSLSTSVPIGFFPWYFLVKIPKRNSHWLRVILLFCLR